MHNHTNLGICAVNYSGQFISSITQLVPHGAAETSKRVLTREALLASMHEGAVFTTMHRKADGTWERWDRVQAVAIDGIEYIKCIADDYPCDDLGDLTA